MRASTLSFVVVACVFALASCASAEEAIDAHAFQTSDSMIIFNGMEKYVEPLSVPMNKTSSHHLHTIIP